MHKRRFIITMGGLVVLAALAVTLLLGACSGKAVSASPSSAPSSNTRVDPTWITPEVNGTVVSVPVDVVKDKVDTHFKVEVDKGTAYFMAYVYGGKTYVRADVCVPCRSINFSLYKGTLVCDSCGTVFKATDGSGVSGACVNYPKASVPFETIDGKIVMKQADLIAAFDATLQPGLP